MTLVMLVCLASSPQICREERLLAGLEAVDARGCMIASVPAIAEWAESNPEWQIARWKCGDGERLARNAN
ncbi:MAG: hypothetical protein DI565_17915 [Ancylobacter novellus]|uniref:Uncharacterized protein n=1 Tax=Ancylobacter novellus TaxID=921 RepID=A0A2W5K949_ANCNO|nr:MAG: hypothetical protein DI565_17915 [Ancylobacter novellus]